MIVSVTLNPCIDHALFVAKLEVGDTNRVIRDERDCGGKGINVSRIVNNLGGETCATGFLGGGSGLWIHARLFEEGVDTDFVEIQGETRVNFSVEDDSGTPPTTFNERGPEISPAELQELKDKVAEYAFEDTWVCLGGSLPPGVPNEVYRELVQIAHQAGAKVLLDADGDPMRLGLEAYPDFIKPNAKEASRVLGQPVETTEQSIAAAKSLYVQLGGGEKIVILSRGADGAVLATQNKVWIGQSPKIESKSTIGSGDSLIGGFLWALLEGQSIEDSFRWGLAAGAATATTDGSQIGPRSVIELLFKEASVVRA